MQIVRSNVYEGGIAFIDSRIHPLAEETKAEFALFGITDAETFPSEAIEQYDGQLLARFKHIVIFVSDENVDSLLASFLSSSLEVFKDKVVHFVFLQEEDMPISRFDKLFRMLRSSKSAFLLDDFVHGPYRFAASFIKSLNKEDDEFLRESIAVYMENLEENPGITDRPARREGDFRFIPPLSILKDFVLDDAKEDRYIEGVLSFSRKSILSHPKARRGLGEYSETIAINSSPTAAPKEILDRLDSSLENLFKKMQEKASIKEEETLSIDKVRFSCLHEESISPTDSSIFYIAMYIPGSDFEKRQIEKLRAAMEEEIGSTIAIKRNAQVKVEVSSKDVEIDDPVQTQTWIEDHLVFPFEISILDGVKKNRIAISAKVYINGLLVSKLSFFIQIEEIGNVKVDTVSNVVKSAFMSYSSDDRADVISIIQGMKKINPNLDVFLDVETLRSGEKWEEALYREIDRREVLFLCWSSRAKESIWVDREWRHALESKGLDGIEPIPLEPPSLCEPPEELSEKHFNDPLLYISYFERDYRNKEDK